MDYTFMYEEALANSGKKKSELPESIQTSINELVSMCRKLADLPDEAVQESEALNDKIDDLDEKIANAIDGLGNEPAPAPETTQTTTTETTPAEESSSGSTGKALVGFAIVGAVIWGAIKIFGGKK